MVSESLSSQGISTVFMKASVDMKARISTVSSNLCESFRKADGGGIHQLAFPKPQHSRLVSDLFTNPANTLQQFSHQKPSLSSNNFKHVQVPPGANLGV